MTLNDSGIDDRPAQSSRLSDDTQRLSDILIRQGVISPTDLELAQRESRKRGILLREVLTALGICLEDEINWAIS